MREGLADGGPDSPRVGARGPGMSIRRIARELRKKRFARPVRLAILAAALTFLLNGASDSSLIPGAVKLNRYDSAAAPEFALDERFFSETGDGLGRGFSITDYSDGPQFLTAFDRFGGQDVLGFPVSRPFAGNDGLLYQITQRALLQWFPAENTVRLANLYEVMEEAGLDDFLLGQFIPRSLADGAANPDEAKSIRLSWMTEQAIKSAFLRNPLVPGDESTSIELYGLPMSRPQSFGAFVAQRFQRIAFHYWVEDISGTGPVGKVVPINGGEILKGQLYEGTEIARPHLVGEVDIVGVDGSTAPAHAVDAALPDGYNVDDVEILRAIKVLEPMSVASEGLEAARVTQTRIAFRDMQIWVLGAFSSSNKIYLSNHLGNQDIRILGTVLLHELVHLADWRADRIGPDYDSCMQAEVRAVTAEATAWSSLVGPDGKRPALTRIERLENIRLDLLQGEGGTIYDHVEDLYEEQCTP